MNKSKTIQSGPLPIYIFGIFFACLMTACAVGLDVSNQGNLFGLNKNAQTELEGLLVIIFHMGFCGLLVNVLYVILNSVERLLNSQS